MVDVPSGSIYYWMYEQGLKHVDLREIEAACNAAGVAIREKDERNYWNGWQRSDLYRGPGKDDIFEISHGRIRERGASEEFLDIPFDQYPPFPEGEAPEDVEKRWVPCSKDNKPLIPWSQGCMSICDAVAMSRQVYLAENMKGTRLIVIDCDGNHGDELDWETMWFLNRWRGETHCLVKPGYDTEIPQSFHLTFAVDRMIRTMHFPYAHIDIVGNRKNSLRYWKNKQWNGIEPAPMTKERWAELQSYIRYRKEMEECRRV